jgi:hypothetical protein
MHRFVLVFGLLAAALPAADPPSTASAALRTPDIDSTSRTLGNLRVVLPKDDQGGFLQPRFSPDGLQLLVTRPGYQGAFVVPAAGGKPARVSPDNALAARWTPDGKVAIPSDPASAKLRVLNLDGTPARTEDLPKDAVYCERDRVYSVPTAGAAPIPLTDSSDRFLEPKLCPKHKMVAFLGLQTGLYLVRADGSAPPVFLGPGESLVWAPDSSFVLFARPKDDGHEIVESDLFVYDSRAKRLFNLTAGSNLLFRSPSLAPDGRTVACEVDGSIQIGTLQGF